ncbi:hypothetical protein [Xanthomonas sp. XNM01]|uniref:hypothetical protein n=1 Tax=Xanthomonas sp. XNM01 TaxID=2769289 RepID=UPI001782B463|nr:hypothetical protein [Xanthomonas sp. XNM01]MBD9368372.1 hypothetical protein [Xanthomonas sp. XNM01]
MKWLSRVFVSAIARRLAFVVVALVLGALGIGSARANIENCTNVAPYCDQGQAFARCQASLSAVPQTAGYTYTGFTCDHLASTKRYHGKYTRTRIRDGYVENGFAGYFYYSNTCQQRTGDGDGPPGANSAAIYVGSGSTCYNGCSYGRAANGEVRRWSFSGGQTVSYTPGGAWLPDGAVCSADDGTTPPEGDYCAREDSMTQCLQRDGRHCAVSSSGKRFCWTAKETGTKTSGNEAMTKSPEGAGINPPRTPPPNNGDWQQTGQGTASTTAGGVTNNYNITNHTSNYGSEGGGGGAEGDPGGGGEGDGEGEDDGVGEPTGEGIGDIYKPTEKTMESIVQTWWQAVQGAPIFAQINNFFGNCSYSGSCPTIAWESDWTGAVSFTQLCDGTIADTLFFAGFVVMAMGAFAAYRIAIY